jgi:hydroxypyruvate isomerase
LPKLAANISMLFTEVPLLERFGRAARAGFKGVEILFPYEHPPEALAEQAAAHGLEVALINLPTGDRDNGERGLASLPGREADFDRSLETALPYAKALGAKRVHVVAGIPPKDADPNACKKTFVRNLRAAAAFFAPHGVDALIEPISPHDIPGFFLTRQEDAIAYLDEAGAPNTGLQMDFYHCQIVQGDLTAHLRRNFARIRHIQISGVPDRHEPDTGEINYTHILAELDRLGYDGWVGCEYHPAGNTEAGLGWARPYGIGG